MSTIKGQSRHQKQNARESTTIGSFSQSDTLNFQMSTKEQNHITNVRYAQQARMDINSLTVSLLKSTGMNGETR